MLTAFSSKRELLRLCDLSDRGVERRARLGRKMRDFAGGPFATGDTGTVISVKALLKQPQVISRDLLNILIQRGGFLADQLLISGTPEQVAGGSAVFQRSGSAYVEAGRDVEEIAEDSDWPRAGWTEQILTELVRQYGLEIPLSNLTIRRNQMDQVTRAERRLANQIVKFVDTIAITLLRTDPGIQTMAGSAVWTNPATDVIGDVASAQQLMDVIDEGLSGSVLVLNKTRRAPLIRNTALRDALKTINGSQIVQTGNVSNFLGLDNIYFTNQIPATEALIVDPGVAGTIADEPPDAAEGWQAYDPGPGFRPIYVQVYRENRPKRTVVAAGRWPAMGLVEPRAVVKITGI